MIFNQYSMVWAAAIIIGGVAFSLWRMHNLPLWVRAGVPLAMTLVAALIWLAARPAATPAVSSLTDAERVISDGKPTVIDFFSEY